MKKQTGRQSPRTPSGTFECDCISHSKECLTNRRFL